MTTFTQTSHEPYDRHYYVLHLDGVDIRFGRIMRSFGTIGFSTKVGGCPT